MPRGNVPTTPALKVLRGQASKKEAEAIAKPVEDAPRPPEGLPDEAAAEWSRVVPVLYSQGVYDPILDRAFMTVYVTAYAVYTAAMVELATGGLMAEGYRGQVKKSPAHQIARDASTLMLAYGSRFGLNPLDRQRLSVPGPSNDVDETFGGLLS